jgi:selenocysteine lyase/cysteine desulfurase
LDLLQPTGVGWNSVVGAHEFSKIDAEWKPDARRYEGGSQNMVGMIALGESLKLLNRFGRAAIGERVVQVTAYACHRLEEVGAVIHVNRQRGHESGIVLFDLPGHDLEAFRQRALDAGIVLSCRAGRLRISPHAYNTEEEIDRLIEEIRKS